MIDSYTLDKENTCTIAPDWGCNMISWRVGGVELMYCPPDLPEKATKITGGGNPILFPSVGRTWDHSSGKPVPEIYRIHGCGKTYRMPSHGILFISKFQKIGETRSSGEVTARYELVVPDRVKEENYPFDVCLTQQFTLKAGCVELEAVLANRGSTPAPAAFGYHPYFAVSSTRREGVEVRLPVSRRLLLTPDTVLPTGKSEPADGQIALEPEVYYDHLFDGRTGNRMSLIDCCAGRAIHIDCSEGFELFVLYSPDGSRFVCIEPWTRGLGAFEKLRTPGWESGDIIPVLQPGEIRLYRAIFTCEESSH